MKKLLIPILLISFLLIGCKVKNIQEKTLQTYFSYEENRELLVSAHRGGKGYVGYPENCLETMQYIKKYIPNALFEIDVAKSKDGVLLLMHDNALDRTSTGSGRVDQNNWEALSKLKLKDNFDSIVDFKIPLFKDVLDWAKKDNAILTVDIKRSVDPEEVLHFIEENNALNQSVIITYSMETAQKLYKLNPKVVLSVSIRNMEEFNRAANSGIPWKNMVAFTGTRLSDPLLYKKLHEKGVMCMLGTLGNLDKQAAAKGDHLYKEWAKLGIDIFAADRALEVQKAITK
ncbi:MULTISPECIES: glycerophosphodiester phosphodiesterase family protein [unclassified Cellulophaga]|uniref:glycerophosphodiester phosphodiesterase family protein n=1 Tax=unclassified Cellulophaga TaxID=2634405 RepID=UPI0026E2081C|nr:MULTISPECIES: glycerophosphodiester phosphodiesterase family protein [unclassified Cellulophaga]MDO6490654.1 glycerophosphodiester phosphodiesterase family protein [Cellulophaga sp. 2_MG-2023]MDO6494152.1 glycerophosphodiester phosphodiesterase family protein [Cellulophaga sp. 3_MG-2023]